MNIADPKETDLPESEEEAAAEIEKLRERLIDANHRYYILDQPEISDDEYDLTMRRLVAIETQFPELITPNSPTQRVGAPLEGNFPEREHLLPMLSLQDVRGEDELAEWEKRIRRHLHLPDETVLEYVCEPKIDGLAMSLIYEDGVLTRGVTRGDGRRGEDITHNVRTISSIPLRLRLQSTLALFEARGEVYMLRSEFEKMNKRQEAEGKPLFANPRNAGAGSVRQKDPSITASRPLAFFAYATGALQIEKNQAPQTQWDTLELLRSAGFRVNDLCRICTGLDAVREFIEYWREERFTVDYATDGVVVKVNDFALQNELGYVGRNPRWACAFKFPPEEQITRVLSIDVNVGRTGALTPLAHFEPVEVAGTTVSKATLHNEDELRRKDVRVGDKVIVRKAGEIIPEVVRVLVDERNGSEQEYSFPTECPTCGAKVMREEGEAVTRCVNAECPAQLKRLVEHFVGRAKMNIDRIGEQLAATLVEQGLVHDVADLFYITKEQLIELERMAEKSAQNVMDSIEAAKTPTLARFLYALGIRHVGERTAELLAEHFGTLSTLQAASAEEIAAVHTVGPVAGQSVRAWFDEPHNQKVVQKLLDAGVRPVEQKVEIPADSPIAGKSFVFTGALEMDRREAESLVKKLGARASGSVSRKTDYVVVGENAGFKAARAQELGVTILSEDEFRRLIGFG